MGRGCAVNTEHHISRTARRLRRLSVAAVATLVPIAFASCGDDDDSPDDTEVEGVTSEVTDTSMVSVDSEVTIGTTLTSEVEVTDVEVSEVEVTEPGATTSG